MVDRLPSGYNSLMDRSTSLPPTPTQRASTALRRVLDIAAKVLRGVTMLAVASAAVVSVAWLGWVIDTPPPDSGEWFVRVVLLALLLVPPAVLLLFVAGLRDLSRLPERTRALPGDVQARARDVGERSRRVSKARGGLPGSMVALFRLGRVVFGSRDALSPYATVAVVLRPPVLLAAIYAALAAMVEVPAALVVLLVLSAT